MENDTAKNGPKHPTAPMISQPVHSPMVAFCHQQKRTQTPRRRRQNDSRLEPRLTHPTRHMHILHPNRRPFPFPALVLVLVLRPHRRDIILDPPDVRHHRRIRARRRRARLRRRHDVRPERRDEEREARVRERPVVLVLDLAQRREEARPAGERGERGVVDAVRREGERGDEVLAAVDRGREAVGERDAVSAEVKVLGREVDGWMDGGREGCTYR